MFLVFTRDTFLVEYLTYKTILLNSFCKHNSSQICKSRLLQAQISIFIYFSRLFMFSFQQLVFKCRSQVLGARPQCTGAYYTSTVCNLQAFHTFPCIHQVWISWSLHKPEGNILRQISFTSMSTRMSFILCQPNISWKRSWMWVGNGFEECCEGYKEEQPTSPSRQSPGQPSPSPGGEEPLSVITGTNSCHPSRHSAGNLWSLRSAGQNLDVEEHI